MKKYILMSALTASVFADGEITATKSNSQMQNQEMMMQSQPSQPVMVNLASARPESDNGWYLFADALYWHADVGSTEWAQTYRLTEGNQQLPDALKSVDFKWDWAFRVGLGVNLNHDKWDSNLYYTWFHTDNSNGVGADNGGGVIDLLGGNLTNHIIAYTTGKIQWDLHYSMFDWELGRWYYVSDNLSLRPHAGVKGGWIHQNIRDHLTLDIEEISIPITTRHTLKNHFWGVGPTTGLNMQWVLGNAGARKNHRFSFIGDFSAALMYGHFDVSYKITRSDLTDVVNPSNLDINLAVPVLQTMMGLSWDTSFNNNRNHFTFKVGYELQYWFRQYQEVRQVYNNYLAFNLAYVGYERIASDLSLQGLTFDFRFDF